MAKRTESISEAHLAFMRRQHIFFVASAAGDSHVNVSPRGAGFFRYLAPDQVAYLDRTGSGNETAAHIQAGGRMTIMFCAIEGPPLILRLYGKGSVLDRRSQEFRTLLNEHFDGEAPLGTRQIIRLTVDLVQTSCGYGVPLFDYSGERDTMERWAENKGIEGLERYWREQNLVSMDGLPTGLTP